MVILIGAAGSGKTTFARQHFRPTEILSSDFFRGLASDDEGDQDASADAFQLLHTVLEMRLRRGRLCVVDATNVRRSQRAPLLSLARQYERSAIAVVFDTPVEACVARAAARKERVVRAEIVQAQAADLERERAGLAAEGFAETILIGKIKA